MLTTEDGRFFYFFVENAGGSSLITTVRAGSLSVTGSNFTGTEQSANFAASQCQLEAYCASGAAVAVTGTISQRSTLTLDGYTWSFDSQYNNASSLALTAGSWSSNLANPNATEGTGGTLDIGSTGVLFDQDTTTNCLVTGQLSLINPLYDAYTISLTYTGTNCASNLNGATASGIAYIDDLGYLNIGVNMPGASTIVETAVAKFDPIGGIWTGVNLPTGTTAYLISDEAGLAFFKTADSSCTDTYETVFQPPDSVNANFIGDSLSQKLPSNCGGVGTNGYYLFFNPMTLQLSAQNDNAMTSTGYTLSPQTSAYNQPSSAAAVAGNWTTPGTDVITIDATGAISETDAASGCAIAGQIASANPGYNIYYLTLHYSGCTSVPADLSAFTTDGTGLNGATVIGLASVDYSVTPNQLDLWYRVNFSDGTGSAIVYVVGTGH